MDSGDDRQRELLSPRERQVIEAMAAGSTFDEIGRELYVSAATIKTYAQRIDEKLGVTDRSSAIAEGFRRGLLR